MRKILDQKLGRIFLGLLIVSVAGVVQNVFWDFLQPLVWFLFYPAAFFAAALGGLEAGLAATAVATFLGWYVFLPPRFSFAIATAGAGISVFAFAATGVAFSIVLHRLRKRSEARVAEKAVLESEKRLRLVLDASNDGIWDWDLTSGLAYLSPRYYEIVGYREGEVVPNLEFFQSLVHPDDWGAVIGTMQRNLDGFASESVIEYRVRTGTGQTLWLRGKGKVVERDATGKPVRMSGIISDITAEKQAALDLLASEARLRATIECAPNVAIQWFDRDARVRYWNPASAALYGWSANEARGRTLDELILSTAQADEFRGILAEINATGKPFGPFENKTQNRNGEPRWVVSTVFSFPADHGQHAFACMDVDITDRKAAEAELVTYRHHLEDLVNERTLALEKARDAAESASRAKGTFLANMSHEIRTPLNAILGMARLVRRDGLTERQGQRMDQLETASNHLLEIINSILDLSKIEAGKLVLEEEPVRLQALADNVADMLRPRAHRQGITLTVECASPGYGLIGDTTKLQQGILNYVANAIKFTPSGTVTLRIRVVEDDAFSALIRFEVSDTGIGIAPDVLARLFSAFEQADNSLTRKYGGTGLGLAITQAIARQMGGEAGAESTLGQGSTFWFTARLAKAESQSAVHNAKALAQEEELRRRFAGRRILLVEDEPINAEIAKALLEEANLRVETAENGEAALAKIQSGVFDAVVMDMQMPVMDGLESTRRIRAMAGFETVPIIAMTANAFMEDRERCLAAGMNDFVAKPITPEAFFATLLKCLSQASERSNVASLVWSPAYSVGVEILDRQHQRLLELCRTAAAITAQGEDFRSAILPLLEQMRSYAQEHFRTEEALLAERNYPGLDAQKLEHQAYADALAEFIFSASLKILDGKAVEQFLADWWIRHILDSDMAYKETLCPARNDLAKG